MKAKQLFEKLIQNWSVKAICFASALILYLFYQNQNIDSHIFSVPLSVYDKNGFVPIEAVPKKVSVYVRGNTDDLAKLRESDITAYLDLNFVPADGKYEFPVMLELSDNANSLNPLELTVVPESVSLAVEQEIYAYIDVSPLISGVPAKGYELKSVTVNPSRVKVSGAKSFVENCTGFQTQAVSVLNAAKSLASEAKIISKSNFINVIDSTVKVTAEIVEKRASKKFERVHVKLANVNHDLEAALKSEFISLYLSGGENSLEKTNSSGILVTADCSKIHSAGTFDVPLMFKFPNSLSLSASDENVKSVMVTFVEKPFINISHSETEESVE